ncbi:hypothetical protein K1719_022476 [Acacia pycnantha]|nr:hypothetical protein K1719_022476 [Acacia pycnantha]
MTIHTRFIARKSQLFESVSRDGNFVTELAIVSELLVDGLRAFRKGSPNMNSLVGFGSIAAFIISSVEDAQSREAPVQRLADSIAGPFVYSVMTLSAATFAFWFLIGSHVFPDVLLNDIAGPEGDPLLLSLKLSVDVLEMHLQRLSSAFYQIIRTATIKAPRLPACGCSY